MRLINADKFEVVGGKVPEGFDPDSYLAGNKEILEMIDNAPTIDAVSKGVYDQVCWERDVAIAQLEELGIGFGQKKPDMVEVVRCKDCEHSEDHNCPNLDESLRYCLRFDTLVSINGFCHKGAKINAEEK